MLQLDLTTQCHQESGCELRQISASSGQPCLPAWMRIVKLLTGTTLVMQKTDCAHTAGRMGELSTESTAKLLFSRRLLKDAVKDGGSKLLENVWYNS